MPWTALARKCTRFVMGSKPLALVVFSVSSTLFALGTASARADAIDFPPDDCPRGSVPQASHAGPYCQPAVCASNSDCSGDPWARCAELGVCIESRTGYSRSGPFTIDAVVAGCDSERDCPAGSRCEIAPRCAGPGQTVWATIVGGAAAGVLALIGLVVWIAQRRQRGEAKSAKP